MKKMTLTVLAVSLLSTAAFAECGGNGAELIGNRDSAVSAPASTEVAETQAQAALPTLTCPVNYDLVWDAWYQTYVCSFDHGHDTGENNNR